MLVCFVFSLTTIVFAYLLYLRSRELNELRQYLAILENDLLQKQIKLEEPVQHSKMHNGFLSENGVDVLTGLPSLQVFADRAQQYFYHSKRFGKSVGIVLLDIRSFAEINAELGTENADVLLTEIVKRLNHSIRQIDTVSRYKADVFILLLPELVQPEAAAYVAQRLLGALERPLTINAVEVSIKTSIGIAVYSLDGENLNALIEHADTALQETKASRDSSYHFYSPELQKISQREAQISHYLQTQDISKKIINYCLPQVNVATNQTTGIKMLAYLEGETLGLLTQEDYQKIAEREHKMLMITECLMLAGIAQLASWEKQNFRPQRLAFAVTAQLIQQKEFVHCVAEVIRKTGIDPGRLAFEMDADSVNDYVSKLQESFAGLKNLGVKLSVGVSALGQLAIQKITRLPISYLKIDQRLLKNLSLNAENEVIVIALHDLSRNMGLEMVVEGVDNEKQKDVLKKLGFDIMQGSLFGAPKAMQLYVV